MLRQWTLYSRVNLLRQIFSKKCFLAPSCYWLSPRAIFVTAFEYNDQNSFCVCYISERCRGRGPETIKCTLKCWKCQHTKKKFIVLKSNLCNQTPPLASWISTRGRWGPAGDEGISLFAPTQFPHWLTKTF